jgi:hypothetical protein
MTGNPSIALVGLGEVGTVFAGELLARSVELRVASRESVRATSSAKRLGIEIESDIARAVSAADIVLLTITGDGLRDVVSKIAPVLREEAILADLTAAAPQEVISAAATLGEGRARFVDVAIMGAVGLHGIRTPLLASGELATVFDRISVRDTLGSIQLPNDATRLLGRIRRNVLRRIELDLHSTSTLAPEELRRRQLAALTGWVMAGARVQPVVLAFEDLHWADPTTLDVLGGMAERGALAPLFIVATTRPELNDEISLICVNAILQLKLGILLGLY